MIPDTSVAPFDRDYFAKWHAKRRRESDPEIVRIVYLPKNAPITEIRFIEVKGTSSENTPGDPINLRLHAERANTHTLHVLSVTPSQWQTIEARTATLPVGWLLDGQKELALR